MFGYVTPCKMELKLKDFEKFKAYYCGLCRTIKSDFGNIPRLALNYDMTFLAILLDSLGEEENIISNVFCTFHPLKKRIIIESNESLKYAAFCNVILTYYKLMDNFSDEKSIKSKFYASLLNQYLKKLPKELKLKAENISMCLNSLYKDEGDCLLYRKGNKESGSLKTLDELSHHFAHVTGYIISDFDNANYSKTELYSLGYNLGKWIYLIDALDDLQKDIKENKFNAINCSFNENMLDYEDFLPLVKDKINFILTRCAIGCLNSLEKLPLKRNEDLLYNILQYGLMEKMDKVFNGKEVRNNEKSL